MKERKFDAKVLSQILESGTDGYVSGESLSRRFGISRTTVWKIITRLRSEGWEISSEPGKGYRLDCRCDRIHPEIIAQEFTAKLIGHIVSWLPGCDSTNDLAKQGARQGDPEGSVYITDHQTSGRGRLGRVWHNQPGKDIALSVLLRPLIPVVDVMTLSLVAGMAVRDALEDSCGLPFVLKWPNDILYNEKKIAGILLEATTIGEFIDTLVIGIGVNCNACAIPFDLKDKATSLLIETGSIQRRMELISAILRKLNTFYTDWVERRQSSPLIAAYKSHCVTLGRSVTLNRNGCLIRGTAKDILPNGSLQIDTQDGRSMEVSSGEILDLYSGEP